MNRRSLLRNALGALLLGAALTSPALSLTQLAAPHAALAHSARGPVPGPDFHGLPAAQFQDVFNYWTQQGLWPVTLTTYNQAGQIFMAGSFQPGANRPVRHLIGAQQYEQDFVTFRAQGFRPAHVNILNLGGDNLRFTAIWTPIDGPFASYWGMTPALYTTRFQQLFAQGYIQTDLFVYTDSGGLKVAATWVKRPFSAYLVYVGMTAADYDTKFATLWPLGYRPQHVVIYPTPAGYRFGAIWEKVPGSWIHRYGMTPAAYQQYYNLYTPQGFRVYQLHAYTDSAGNPYYSAIWTKP